MSEYNGNIELISGLKQKNNGNFPLLEASAIQVDDDGKRLDTKLKELETTSSSKSFTVTVDEDGNAVFE